MEVSSSALFITLTYNDEHLPENQELSKRDLQLFLKRLRKRNPGIRYFAVGEYGTQGNRPHYHAVLFNLVSLDDVSHAWCDKNKIPIGFVKGDRAVLGRIRYMVSYMAIPPPTDRSIPPFRLMSRNPGLGANYVKKMGPFHRARSDCVVHDFGVMRSMPRYYTDKIFDPGQRRYIKLKQQIYAQQNPIQIDQVDHDRLLKKLNRKSK